MILTSSDSLVSSQTYEIFRTVYGTSASDSTQDRISVIQNTLGQLRLANIATLDAITTHFTRLIELTSADEPYITALAHNLAPCILRPRTETSLTMNERYSFRLIRDLFDHKDAIFTELKRQSSNHSQSSTSRARAVSSTDESNRRANMEARIKAISERSRDKSPAPTVRHRRDRSSGAETRFPIAAPSGAAPTPRKVRDSLEVPNSADSSPAPDVPPKNDEPATNGHSAPSIDTAVAFAAATAGLDGSPIATESPSSTVEKRDSLTRVGARFPRKTPLNRQSLTDRSKRESLLERGAPEHNTATSVTAEEERPAGVTLEDKPMDD